MRTVVLVVPVRLYREALARVLAEQRDVQLVGDAASADAALAEIGRCRPDVVLFELGLPNALALMRRVSADAPGAQFVAIGFSGSDEDALAAASAGISGYIGVDQPLRAVPDAIRSVTRGEAPCDGRIAAALLRRVAASGEGGAEPAPLPELTPRERSILELVARGLSNKEIAGELLIGVATVKSHVHAVLRKLGVSRRGAAAAVLRRAELMEPVPPSRA